MSTAAYQAAWRKHRYLHGPRRVDALGTVRRLRALAALGHTFATIASVAGLDRWALTALARDGRAVVNIDTARGVANAYDTLSGTPAAPSRYATLARNAAQRRGWAPPAAWLDIDDPADTPDTGWRPTARRTPDEVVEEYAHLRSYGLADETIAERLGMQVDSLHTALRRAA